MTSMPIMRASMRNNCIGTRMTNLARFHACSKIRPKGPTHGGLASLDDHGSLREVSTDALC